MASPHRKSKFRPIWDFPGFGVLSVGFFAFLYVPILVLVAYSFNGSKFAMVWSEFSWRWYLKLLENDDIHSAAINSLIVAFFAAPAANHYGNIGSACNGSRWPVPLARLYRRFNYPAIDGARNRHRSGNVDLFCTSQH